ncbi:MAG: double zinc ribbon domain-containing protein [Alphaproteobacteria bacterium]
MAMSANALASVRKFGTAALDLLLPPQCLSCRQVVAAPGTLCGACFAKIRFLSAPCCAACGTPFEFDPGGADALCGNCVRERPSYARARAVFRYDDSSRSLVLAFKHGDRIDAASAYARWLARAGDALIADADLIAPVPLHWTRLFHRRYNQSALLANALARLVERPVLPDLLHRRRRTPSQGGLGRAERVRNVRGAFAVRTGSRPSVAGKRILLVDDVLTTGATVEACASALLKADALAVDVLTLARVVRDG